MEKKTDDKKTVRYSTAQYAKKIRKSRQWVNEMIKAGTLKAEKVGRAYVIEILE